MNAATATETVTRLLNEAVRGQSEAWEKLTPLIYDQIRDLASALMQFERKGHTLQATALVHEAYVRLVNQREAAWNSRTHFYGAAARAMRRVLVDHARGRKAAKRGGEMHSHALDTALVALEAESGDLLDLDDALTRLAEMDAEQARIVELRFFSGLSIEETASLLGVSESSVERGWRAARAWLFREIRGVHDEKTVAE